MKVSFPAQVLNESGIDVRVFTPKALHNKAQGQRRSRATLGLDAKTFRYAEGVIHGFCITPLAYCDQGFSFTQGALRDPVALRDPGLCYITASQ